MKTPSSTVELSDADVERVARVVLRMLMKRLIRMAAPLVNGTLSRAPDNDVLPCDLESDRVLRARIRSQVRERMNKR